MGKLIIKSKFVIALKDNVLYGNSSSDGEEVIFNDDEIQIETFENQEDYENRLKELKG